MSFRWSVHQGGYEWTEAAAGKALRARLPKSVEREYAPLEHVGLYRVFVETDGSLDEIARFANRFGLLGMGAGGEESYGQWKREIGNLGAAIAMWDGLGEEPTEAATKGLATFVNRHLHRTSRLGGTPHTKGRIAKDTPPTLCYDVELKRFRITLSPSSLINAFWVQLCVAIVEQKQHKKCPTCGTWFEVSPELRRADARYCREACRTKAYRDKKEEAKRLFFSGVPVAEIGVQLNTKPKIIRNWVQNRNVDAEE
jgi:hypothetical protein